MGRRRERASSCDDGGTTWIFSSCSGILELRRGIQDASCVGPGKSNLPFELRILKADKARTNILKISELGIVEMTRKRSRESLIQSLCEPCPYCEGNGLVKGKDTIIMDLYRELSKELPARKKKVLLYVSTSIAGQLTAEPAVIEDLEKRFGKKVIVKAVERF